MEGNSMQEMAVVGEEIDSLGDDPKLRAVLATVAIAVALLSFFLVADIASSTETHSSTISSLDEKKDTVMGLVAASTAASAAVSLLPGDAGTPIAAKLVDLSADSLVVIAAIYLEKYLLTTMGFVAFKILVPVGCVVFAGSLFIRKRATLRRSLTRLSAKLTIFGIAMFFVVPVSIGVSAMIESTYQDSVEQTIAMANQTTENIESEAEEASSGDDDTTLLDWISGLAGSVGNAVSELTADAQRALNGFVETLAVMIVTSCVIPIVVLLIFIWLVKIILGVDVSAPAQMLRPRIARKAAR